MNPDQPALKEIIRSGYVLFAICAKQLGKQTTKVMTDGLTIIITVYLLYLGDIAYFYLIILHNIFVPK